MKFMYRKLFNLSEAQMDSEPIDVFYTNLYIHGQIENKKRIESKNG